MIRHRKEKSTFRLSALLFLASVVFFIIIFKWLIPAFETENKKFDLFNYGALGSTPGQALLFILTHPLEAIKLLFVNHLHGDTGADWVKMKYYLVFGASGGVLLLYRPAYLICLIPVIAKKMYNDDPLRWSYETYYGVETASILPALVFMLISELNSERWRHVLSIVVLLFSIAACCYCFKVSYYPMGYTKFEFFNPSFYHPDFDLKEVNYILSKVPEKAAVSASPRLLPHLANRDKIYYFPAINDAEYICVRLTGETWPISPQEFDNEIKKIIKSGLWKAEYSLGGVMLFRRRSN
jgi:hypothetical protein